MTSRVRTVAVVGATHGNELSGLYLARHLIKSGAGARSPVPPLSFRGVVANPEAAKRCARYVDEDLNRCFTLERLAGSESTYEARRARALNQELGPKGAHSKTDYVLDLHNTTANTGVLLCFHRNDALSRELLGHLRRLDPSIRAAFWDFDDPPFLPSIGRLGGMTVEAGPVAHGTLNTRIMSRVRRLLDEVQDYLECLNASDADSPRVKQAVLIGHRVAQVDFPRDEHGDLAGFLHPDLQGAPELSPPRFLRPGQPLFVDVEGATVEAFHPAKFAGSWRPADAFPGAAAPASAWAAPVELYPLFSNEAAYLEKRVAFYLNRLVPYDVDVLSEEFMRRARRSSGFPPVAERAPHVRQEQREGGRTPGAL